MNYINLPIGPLFPNVVNAVIEVPRDETNKYEYSEALQVFRLDRPLYGSVHYPGDYGFVPSTLSDDNDPLDIIILVDAPSFPGCVMEARPIGYLDMVDNNVPDKKVLAVGETSPYYREITDYRELASHILDELQHFFTIYKQLEGSHTLIRGWRDVKEAREVIRESHRMFLKKPKK